MGNPTTTPEELFLKIIRGAKSTPAEECEESRKSSQTMQSRKRLF